MAGDKESELIDKALALEQEVVGDSRLRQSLYDRIRQLNRPQRIMLAVKGDRESRMVLLKSYDPQVYHYLAKNPRLTTEEVVELTKSALLMPPTIELIAGNREWIKNERVKLHLVVHNKSPIGLALNLMSLLSRRSLREVARNAYVRGSIRKTAISMIQRRV